MDNDHLAARLIGFLDAMGAADFIAAENAGGLDVEPVGRSIGGNLPWGQVGNGEVRRAESKTAEELG